MSAQHSVLSTQSYSHVRMLLGDISLTTGDTQSAMESYLKEATGSPAHWYQAGQIAFREGDFVSTCTVRPGFPDVHSELSTQS